MKAVMLSIQPQYCELIASGEKTIEVRKTVPKLETPFKCYIYCTGGKGKEVIKNIAYRWNGTRLIKRRVDKGWLKDKPEQTWQILLDYGFTHPIHNGDYELNGKVIGEFICSNVEWFTVGSLRSDDIEELACLSYKELLEYFYKPNELDGKTAKWGYALHISDLKIYDKPKELSEFIASTPKSKFKAHGDNLTRPPMSWQYVEKLLNA